jgi:hypothetical protein
MHFIINIISFQAIILKIDKPSSTLADGFSNRTFLAAMVFPRKVGWKVADATSFACVPQFAPIIVAAIRTTAITAKNRN